MPFELGRPLGVPGDAEFQIEVLRTALKLLELSGGPVIEDFPTEAPVTDGMTIWACPVNLTTTETKFSKSEELIRGFKQEMNQLRPWYDLAVKQRQRSTLGLSGFNLDDLADFFSSFIENGLSKNPSGDLPLALTFRLAVDDLKAYYCEAITAQPGKVAPSSKQLEDWFWGETVAAKVLLEVKRACENSNDNMLQLVVKRLLVPMSQMHRTV
ncbi:MAG: hypothetical protein HY730_04590 [Candidatus Tectomicrobia bacterium]|uniref:Uncharacterized protein n=1 Tax=Tectimicrobiota bacterium TaxID=2528274 RepID=A0A933GKP4_UNCTE|nr:hypothetical protein [Candidatus Tectomicrobia bacterium]